MIASMASALSLDRWLGRDSEAETVETEWPRCDYCGLPGICFGADLAFPKQRCPRHCREYPQFGGRHGPPDYLGSHGRAEGIELPGGAL